VKAPGILLADATIDQMKAEIRRRQLAAERAHPAPSGSRVTRGGAVHRKGWHFDNQGNYSAACGASGRHYRETDRALTCARCLASAEVRRLDARDNFLDVLAGTIGGAK
jgi:hypothetical protein